MALLPRPPAPSRDIALDLVLAVALPAPQPQLSRTHQLGRSTNWLRLFVQLIADRRKGYRRRRYQRCALVAAAAIAGGIGTAAAALPAALTAPVPPPVDNWKRQKRAGKEISLKTNENSRVEVSSIWTPRHDRQSQFNYDFLISKALGEKAS